MSIAYHIIKIFEKAEGRNFSPFYKSFKKSEFWDLETLKALQFQKLKELVRHAFDTVPYYREKFNVIGFNPTDLQSIDDIKLLPFLTKSDLKNNFNRLISTAYDRSELIEYATGGSTGEPTRFLLTKEQYDARAAISFKTYQMTGWDFLKRTIFLSGAPIEETTTQRLKARLKSCLMRQKTVSSFDLTEDKMHYLYRYIQKKRPEVIFGYVSALLMFSQYLEANKLNVKIPIIVQVAELIYPDQIAYIEQFLGGKFFKHYGARDAIAMGVECQERRGLHINMDTLLIEILRNGKETFDEDGEVFITDLYSFGMPLIRYQIGDVARWKKEICVCGRCSPLFEVTQGRTTNIISTRDGNFMTGLFIPHLFKELSSKISKYQVYQPDLERLIIRIVKQKDYSDADQRFLEDKLKEKLGSHIQIVFEYPDEIPNEASGKYEFVKSDVPVSFGNLSN